MADMNTILGRALDKRDRIAEDARKHGEDISAIMSPQYLKMLVEEEIKADLMRDRCNASYSQKVKEAADEQIGLHRLSTPKN